jgi:hypothetical protein
VFDIDRQGKEEPKGKMNTSNPAWRFMILLLLSIISAASCQQPKLPAANMSENISQTLQPAGPSENISLESGFEIPQGTAPQRVETYDDIVLCEHWYEYRANCRVPGPDYIKEAEVTLSGCKLAPRVTYRDHIETKAGEIRYNIFYVGLQDSSLRTEIGRIYVRTGKPPIDYKIKLLGTCPDIQVKKMREDFPYIGSEVGDKLIYLMIEISPQLKPGDYTLHFIVEANGQNCGELPCIIHVTE